MTVRIVIRMAMCAIAPLLLSGCTALMLVTGQLTCLQGHSDVAECRRALACYHKPEADVCRDWTCYQDSTAPGCPGAPQPGLQSMSSPPAPNMPDADESPPPADENSSGGQSGQTDRSLIPIRDSKPYQDCVFGDGLDHETCTAYAQCVRNGDSDCDDLKLVCVGRL